MHSYDIQPDSPTLRIAPMEHESEFDEFFSSMARAIRAGEASSVREFWALPGIAISEEGCHTVGSEGEVRRFFRDADERARERGARRVRAEIKRVQWLAESLALVEVRWLFIGHQGEEIDDEGCTFAVRRDEEGGLRVHAALLHGKRPLFH